MLLLIFLLRKVYLIWLIIFFILVYNKKENYIFIKFIIKKQNIGIIKIIYISINLNIVKERVIFFIFLKKFNLLNLLLKFIL